MNTAIILLGLPGAGKSKYAEQWAGEKPTSSMIIAKDSIRTAMGTYWVPEREQLVSVIEAHMLTAAFNYGYDVCIDDAGYNEAAKCAQLQMKLERMKYAVRIVLLDASYDVCMRRIKTRVDNKFIDIEVIDRLSKYLQHTKQSIKIHEIIAA